MFLIFYNILIINYDVFDKIYIFLMFFSVIKYYYL